MTVDRLGLPGYVDAVPVATGGTSTVWRARETAFDRLVAVKVLAFPVLDEDVRRRFVRELAMAGRLSGHPSVLTVHSSGFTADGRPYLTSEWCPAGSLADVVARSGPLTDAQVAHVGVAVAEALDAAHRAGVVHRDVKPQNVFVTAYGRPALADFGIAVAAAEVTSATDALTPAHAAPEVLQGGAAAPAADVWGLGSTLWTLLTGRPPYAATPGEGVLPAMLRVLSEPLPATPASAVADALRAMLTKDPAARPTAAQAAELLRPLAVGAAPLPLDEQPLPAATAEPTQTRPPAAAAPAGAAGAGAAVFPLLPQPAPSQDATVHRPSRPAAPVEEPARRDRRALLAGAAAAAVALVAVGGWALTQRSTDRDVVPVAAEASPSVAPAESAGPHPSAPPTLPTPGTDAALGLAARGPAAPEVAGAPRTAGGAVDAPPAAAPPQQHSVAQAPAPQPAAPRAPATSAPPAARAPAPQPARLAVYRCDRGAEDLLYTTSSACKPGYALVRQAWSVTKDTGVPGTTPLWRLRNASTGVHLLTWSSAERDGLLSSGWDADGQVGWVRTAAAEGWTRIWRLHDGTRYAYTNDASLQIWEDRGFRVEGQFWS